MEIIDYIGTDGFTHHLLVNNLGIPFMFYILLICGAVSLIYLILKKIIG